MLRLQGFGAPSPYAGPPCPTPIGVGSRPGRECQPRGDCLCLLTCQMGLIEFLQNTAAVRIERRLSTVWGT